MRLSCVLTLVLLAATGSLGRAETFTVTTTGDSNDGACDSHCSLREAVVAANGNGVPDVIVLPAGRYSLTIEGVSENVAATGDLDLTENVDIHGEAANTTIIDAGGSSGLGDRVFDVRAGATVELRDLTVRGGTADLGGGININDDCTLNLIRTAVTENSATVGGGIYLTSNVVATLDRCTVNRNSAIYAGGAIYLWASDDSVDITNSTISNNSCGTDGGGILLAGVVTVTNSTAAGNVAVGNGDWIRRSGAGTVSHTNSVVVGDCYPSGGGTSGGGNLESPGDTCNLHQTDDQASVTDPGIRPLAGYGGPTETHALLADSPAIDNALNAPCPSTDQRDAPRNDGSCDCGAFEAGAVAPGPNIFWDGFESGDTAAWS